MPPHFADYSVSFFGEYPDLLLVVDRDTPGCISVTNDARRVVSAVLRHPEADGGRTRIFYRDSEGIWDELKHDGLDFIGFAPLSPEERLKFASNGLFWRAFCEA